MDYANKVGAVIIYDAAYEAYISEDGCSAQHLRDREGARTCAIELRSFSKNAGFTGTRLGFTVVPKGFEEPEMYLGSQRFGQDGMELNINGAPYIIQKAGNGQCYTEEGRAQLKEQVAYYMQNAKIIKEGLAGRRI